MTFKEIRALFIIVVLAGVALLGFCELKSAKAQEPETRYELEVEGVRHVVGSLQDGLGPTARFYAVSPDGSEIDLTDAAFGHFVADECPWDVDGDGTVSLADVSQVFIKAATVTECP